MITVDNIVKHELVGIQTRIVDSTNSQIIGLNGTIIDETKSMLKINTSKGVKLLPKSINTWSFNVNGQEKIIEGPKISKRPFERIGVKA